MLLTLRVVHILTGVFWAGTMFFLVSFLMPAFRDVGPAAGPLATALAKRRMFVWMPVMAILTIASGIWLYGMRAMGGGNWVRGREAQTLGIGAVAALIAFIIGVTVTRPAMMKAESLTQQAQALSGTERDATLAMASALRTKSFMGNRIIATLLLIAVVTMAIAQYLV